MQGNILIINERNTTKHTNAVYPEYHGVISFMVYAFHIINVSSIRYIRADYNDASSGFGLWAKTLPGQ